MKLSDVDEGIELFVHLQGNFLHTGEFFGELK